jgi:dihydropteroate synthase
VRQIDAGTKPQATRVASSVTAAGRLLTLDSSKPTIMGIINVGEDSVADERRLWTLEDQLRAAHEQIADGAQIIDVGAQSGRTDTPAISIGREVELLCPLISKLANDGTMVSVDTWRVEVAAAALQAGAAIINDVSGLAEPDMAALAADSGAALVLMHTKAAPKAQRFPRYEDPLADVAAMLERLIEHAFAAGAKAEQLILDPGLDYAKTPSESIAVLRRLHELNALQRPLLLAVSRKYFVGMLTGRPPVDRLAGTLAALSFGVDAGASIVRVHDVAAVADFLAVRGALHAEEPPELIGDPQDQALKWLPPKLRTLGQPQSDKPQSDKTRAAAGTRAC